MAAFKAAVLARRSLSRDSSKCKRERASADHTHTTVLPSMQQEDTDRSSMAGKGKNRVRVSFDIMRQYGADGGRGSITVSCEVALRVGGDES